jgi:ribosomal protein S18 acetylase RimI-like enzyme
MPDHPSPEPTLRRATGADADAVRDLVHAAYRDYAPLIGRTPLPMLVDYAEAVRTHEVWALEADGRLVGIIELVPEADHLWIENVAVAPAAQGGGHGRRLLRHAEVEARRRGYREIGLLTNERYERNIAMYERYGYRETHRTPREGTDLVHFRKRLVDEVGTR